MDTIEHNIDYDDLEPILDGLKSLAAKVSAADRVKVNAFINAITPEREFEVSMTVDVRMTVTASSEGEAEDLARDTDSSEWNIDHVSVTDTTEK